MSTQLAHVALRGPPSHEIININTEVFVNTFFEVMGKVEAAYSDEIAQAPSPHWEKLRLELAASLQTMQTVLNLSGLRMAQRFVVTSTSA